MQPRRIRRAKWRKNIRVLAQSPQAKEGGYYDRADRRRRAYDLWGDTASPYATRVTPRWGHWMARRVDALQRGLIALCWGGK